MFIVFVDGQTGSGKTHSIMGVVPSTDGDDFEGLFDVEQQCHGQGAIPRAIEQIFADLISRQSYAVENNYGDIYYSSLRSNSY